MILGSHNTMTYLPPLKWWLYPFRWIAKCQSVNVKQQHEKYGVNFFDLRISYDENNKAIFKHGLMRYKGDVESVLAYLNSIKAQVRLMLEDSKVIRLNEVLFYNDCNRWAELYHDINFFCGNRKFDWKKIYPFNDIEKNIKHLYSSMQGGKIDDLFPEYFAIKNNDSFLKENKDFSGIVMVDFVNFQ